MSDLPTANILLVEGYDDLYVTANIWEKNGLPKKHINIKQMGGDGLLPKTLRDTFLASGLENLGILIDADTNLNKRWKDISKMLTALGYEVPLQPTKGGAILSVLNKTRVGIWVMPTNELTGELEDFLVYLVPDPANDELWKLSEKCVNETIELVASIDKTKTKAHIHTYLAWQVEAGVPFGNAIKYSYFDTHKPEALEYLKWLKDLFPLGTT